MGIEGLLRKSGMCNSDSLALSQVSSASVFKYASRGYGLRFLQSYIDHATLRDMEHYAQRGRDFISQLLEALHTSSITRREIEYDQQRSPEPQGTSCLTGLEVLMRHVALWEGDQRRDWNLEPDSWSSNWVSVLNLC